MNVECNNIFIHYWWKFHFQINRFPENNTPLFSPYFFMQIHPTDFDLQIQPTKHPVKNASTLLEGN